MHKLCFFVYPRICRQLITFLRVFLHQRIIRWMTNWRFFSCALSWWHCHKKSYLAESVFREPRNLSTKSSKRNAWVNKWKMFDVLCFVVLLGIKTSVNMHKIHEKRCTQWCGMNDNYNWCNEYKSHKVRERFMVEISGFCWNA